MPQKDILGNVPWDECSLIPHSEHPRSGVSVIPARDPGLESTLANREMGLLLLLKFQHVSTQSTLPQSLCAVWHSCFHSYNG